RARTLTWDASAHGLLTALHTEVAAATAAATAASRTDG
ncbi:MAG: hypothetical protein RLZZ362_642, partial [Actinomycetota bacterium]